MPDSRDRLLCWFAGDDTGISSRYMAAVLGAAAFSVYLPRPPYVDAYPYDPADFGRCVRLLDAIPELREYLSTLAFDTAHGPVWNAIAEEWDDLERMYREDLPTGRSDRLWRRLEQLRGVSRA